MIQGEGNTTALTKNYFRSIAVALALCVCALATAFTPTTAHAGKVVDRIVGGTTVSDAAGDYLNTPRGVAVNRTGAGAADPGDVYVVDASNNRIQQLASDGTFVRAFGQDVIAASVNERQLLTIIATSGTYTLSFNGSTTSPIAFNANAPTVDNALDALTSINGDANVAVSGSVATGFTITFQGTLAASDRPQTTVSTSQLTGSATVITLADGAAAGTTGDTGTGFEVCTVRSHCKAGVTSAQTGGALSNPQGIAIDQTDGSLYVSDQGNLRVQKFSADGSFERVWGWDVLTGGVTAFEVCSVAVSCKAAAAAGSEGGRFGSILGHPAVNPSSGNVYVADTSNRRIQEFEADGDWVRAWGWDVVVAGGTGEQLGTTKANEQQQVFVSKTLGTITGGTFDLTFEGQTATISGLADGPTAQAALEALPNIGPGDVSVTAAAQSGGVGVTEYFWTVEFTGSLGLTDVPQMILDASKLVYSDSGGFSPTITMTTTVPGGFPPRFEVCIVITECKAGESSFPTAEEDGSFDPGNPSFNVIGGPLYLAVDSGGTVYASDRAASNRVQRFDSTETAASGLLRSSLPVTPLSGTTNTATTGLVVDPGNGNLYVARSAAIGVLEIADPDGTPSAIDRHYEKANLAPNAIAVDQAGEDLYLSSTTGGHRVFAANDDGAPVAAVTMLPATDVQTTSATVSAEIDSNGLLPTAWRLETSSNGTEWSTVSSGQVPGGAEQTVSGSAIGLLPGFTYKVRVITQKAFGNPEMPSSEGTFATVAIPPTIHTTSAQPLGDTSARVSASINPNSTPTSYRFEYGPVGSFTNSVPVPDASIGSGFNFVFVAQALTGLAPSTTYQYRAIATSTTKGTTTGPTRTFTTGSAPAAPAGRAYELVSPPDKVGGTGVGTWYANVGSLGTSGIAAYNGDRFASISYYGGTLADGGFAFASDVTFGERTSTGWVNRAGFNRQAGLGSSEFARLPLIGASNDDLSLTNWTAPTVMQIFGQQTQIFSGVSEAGSALRDWSSGRWEILGPEAPEQQASNGGTSIVRMSAVASDGRHVVVAGQLRGVAGSGDPTHHSFTGNPSDWIPGNDNIYLYDVSGGLSDTFPGESVSSLVNVCTGEGPDRTEIPSVDGTGKVASVQCPAALAGRDARLISPRGASLVPSARKQLSDDGSRVFFISPDGRVAENVDPCTGTGAVNTKCPPQLYVRQQNDDGSVTTRWISQSMVSDQAADLMSAAVFEGATPDGDKVFFRTASPLTPDDPNGGPQVPDGVKTGAANPISVDLYMYDLPDGPDDDPATADADPAGGELIRISAGPTGAGDGNVSTDSITSFTGSLRALGADGSRVYFTTAAPLPGVPAPVNGTITAPGGAVNEGATKNLYLYDTEKPPAERWRYVAKLPAASALGACASKGVLSTGGLTAFDATEGTVAASDGNCVGATTDASFITFFTDGRLTADDPDSTSGDVYAYDAAADELTRISAPQGGPGGSHVCVTRNDGGGMGARCNGDPFISGLGSKAPLGLITDPADPDDRVAFFESASRLVSEDKNDVYDVYQWRNGELSLLSTGAPGADHALYRGNDRTGRNVYIATRDSLTWQDVDAVPDIYSARLGGGFPEPVLPPACDLLADGCQGAPAAPPAPKGASSTALAGVGNLVEKPKKAKKKRCAKGKVRKGRRCVARKSRNAKRTAKTKRRAAK